MGVQLCDTLPKLINGNRLTMIMVHKMRRVYVIGDISFILHQTALISIKILEIIIEISQKGNFCYQTFFVNFLNNASIRSFCATEEAFKNDIQAGTDIAKLFLRLCMNVRFFSALNHSFCASTSSYTNTSINVRYS